MKSASGGGILAIGFIAILYGFAGPSGMGLLIGLVCLIVGGARLYQSNAPVREQKQIADAEAQREMRRIAEARRQSDEEAKAKLEEQRTQEARDRAYKVEQDKMIDETGASKLRANVNELINLVEMLDSDANRQNLVQTMNETVGRIAALRLAPAYYADEFIQFETGLILRKLRDSGLEREILYERLQKVMRYNEAPPPPSRLSIQDNIMQGDVSETKDTSEQVRLPRFANDTAGLPSRRRV